MISNPPIAVQSFVRLCSKDVRAAHTLADPVFPVLCVPDHSGRNRTVQGTFLP